MYVQTANILHERGSHIILEGNVFVRVRTSSKRTLRKHWLRVLRSFYEQLHGKSAKDIPAGCWIGPISSIILLRLGESTVCSGGVHCHTSVEIHASCCSSKPYIPIERCEIVHKRHIIQVKRVIRIHKCAKYIIHVVEQIDAILRWSLVYSFQSVNVSS